MIVQDLHRNRYKKMDLNVKKLVKDAGAALSRVVQVKYT